MNFKNYELIGDVSNRKKYSRLVGTCEICKTRSGVLNIHHHIKQQKAPIEVFNNYSLLCQWNCHRLMHANLKQFTNEIKISMYSCFYKWDKEELWEYMHKLKWWEVDDLYEEFSKDNIIIYDGWLQKKDDKAREDVSEVID